MLKSPVTLQNTFVCFMSVHFSNDILSINAKLSFYSTGLTVCELGIEFASDDYMRRGTWFLYSVTVVIAHACMVGR